MLGYGPVDYDLNSNLILWRETKKHGLSAADNNSSYVELDMHRVDKAGGVIEKISYVQLQRYRPGDADNLYEISHILMALGGGFSEHLERITETKALRSGSLQVVAQGSYGPTLRGTWKLVVDPEADYLVQNASFVKDGTSEPLLTFESSGIFRAAVVVCRETKKHGLSAADNNSSYVELDMHRVDKAGGVIEKISYVQLQRYRPGDADNLYEISHILMALGGGFSEHLERITETKALRSGFSDARRMCLAMDQLIMTSTRI